MGQYVTGARRHRGQCVRGKGGWYNFMVNSFRRQGHTRTFQTDTQAFMSGPGLKPVRARSCPRTLV